ncbi:MAG: DUF3078 domain-containing protein [Cyclobacteriaceae bacterium]|nr:DUF3078 domain-containing protein [Cyclobacteriaceae bacterium]MCH8516792.1 DUF3078 domain-containing protein [Cyclobacteriaceae bacterium]
MYRVFLSILIGMFCIPIFLFGQDEAEDSLKHWSLDNNINLAFSQVALNNWNGGGESSIAGTFDFRGLANYEKGAILWENRLDFQYGIQRLGESDQPVRKTADNLIAVSRYSYRLNENFRITSMLDFRTQIDRGDRFVNREVEGQTVLVREKISEFMAPGWLVASLGATFRRNENFSVTVSPLTGKYTFVLNDSLSNAGAFGVAPGEKILAEFGTSLAASVKGQIFENVQLRSNILLFSDYGNFGNTDVNWEGAVIMKINKFMQASVTAILIYDEDVDILRSDGTTGPAVQFNSTISVGIGFKL